MGEYPPAYAGGYRYSCVGRSWAGGVSTGAVFVTELGRAGTARVVTESDLTLAKTNLGEVGYRKPKLESFNLSPPTQTRMKTTSTYFLG